MKKKMFLTVILVFVVCAFIVNVHVYAAPAQNTTQVLDGVGGSTGGTTSATTNSNILNNIISQGNSFGNSGSSTSLGTMLSGFITGDIMDVVLAIGNLIFAAITVILGAKYIWSSADGKAQVLESLPAFVVAIVFFYLGESIVNNLLTPAANELAGSGSWNTLAGKILGTINEVVRYASFAGILVLGLKYMFASAEGKSQMKTSMGALFLGIIFVFSASNVVNFIIDIAEGAL